MKNVLQTALPALVLLLTGILLAGCVYHQNYACPDGRLVTEASLCGDGSEGQPPTTLEKTYPTPTATAPPNALQPTPNNGAGGGASQAPQALKDDLHNLVLNESETGLKTSDEGTLSYDATRFGMSDSDFLLTGFEKGFHRVFKSYDGNGNSILVEHAVERYASYEGSLKMLSHGREVIAAAGYLDFGATPELPGVDKNLVKTGTRIIGDGSTRASVIAFVKGRYRVTVFQASTSATVTPPSDTSLISQLAVEAARKLDANSPAEFLQVPHASKNVVTVIGTPSTDLLKFFESDEFRAADFYYAGSFDQRAVNEGVLNNFDILIAEGNPVCDRAARSAIASRVESGGDLILVQDACTRVSDDLGAFGWSIGNSLNDVVPVSIGSNERQLESLVSQPAYGRLRLIDANHPAFNQTGFLQFRSNLTFITNPKPDANILAYVDGNSIGTPNDQAYLAIVESGGKFEGKTMYFAFDPASASAPQGTGNLLLNTLVYLRSHTTSEVVSSPIASQTVVPTPIKTSPPTPTITPTEIPPVIAGIGKATNAKLKVGQSLEFGSKTLDLVAIMPIAGGYSNKPFAVFQLHDAAGTQLDYFTMNKDTSEYDKNGISLKTNDVLLGAPDSSYADITVFPNAGQN